MGGVFDRNVFNPDVFLCDEATTVQQGGGWSEANRAIRIRKQKMLLREDEEIMAMVSAILMMRRR